MVGQVRLGQVKVAQVNVAQFKVAQGKVSQGKVGQVKVGQVKQVRFSGFFHLGFFAWHPSFAAASVTKEKKHNKILTRSRKVSSIGSCSTREGRRRNFFGSSFCTSSLMSSPQPSKSPMEEYKCQWHKRFLKLFFTITDALTKLVCAWTNFS